MKAPFRFVDAAVPPPDVDEVGSEEVEPGPAGGRAAGLLLPPPALVELREGIPVEAHTEAGMPLVELLLGVAIGDEPFDDFISCTCKDCATRGTARSLISESAEGSKI